jgi:predicted transcriptional regulator
MATTSEIVTTSVKLASALHKRVEILASARHQTPDSVISEAIEQYVERKEKREQFRLDTLAPLADYDRTGLHLKGDEVDERLARLEAGEDVPPPKCHS